MKGIVVYERGRKISGIYVLLSVMRNDLNYEFTAYCEEYEEIFRGSLDEKQVRKIIDQHNKDVEQESCEALRYSDHHKTLHLLLTCMKLVDPIPICTLQLCEQEGSKIIVCRYCRKSQPAGT